MGFDLVRQKIDIGKGWYYDQADILLFEMTHCSVLFEWQVGVNFAKIFDLASLTKPLFSFPFVFNRLKSKNLDLDATIEDVWSSFQKASFPLQDTFRNLKVRDLLSHQSFLKPWHNFWVQGSTTKPDRKTKNIGYLASVFQRPGPWFDKSKESPYSDLGYIMLGLCLADEAESKDGYYPTIDAHYQNYKGHETLQSPLRLDPTLVSPTGFCPWRGRLIRGEIHDENQSILGGLGLHCGLFGNSQGVLRAIEAIRADSELYKDWWHFGLRGGEDQQTRAFGEGRSRGHYGFTGTSFWLEKERGYGVIFLTNRVAKARIFPEFKVFREELFRLCWEALAHAPL